MFQFLKDAIRKFAPASHLETDTAVEEYVVTVRLPERGERQMLIAKIEHSETLTVWDWKFLGRELHCQTRLTVTLPKTDQVMYERTYDGEIADEDCLDMAIHAMEGDYTWLRKLGQY